MGTWGVGIGQDDYVEEVQDSFRAYVKKGQSVASATKSTLAEYGDDVGDTDYKLRLWLGIAAMQWKYGKLDKGVLAKVKSNFKGESAGSIWGNPGEKLFEQRMAAVKKFIDKISEPNPKPSKPPKQISRKPKFTPGDCLSIKLKNGQYGAALVTAVDHSKPEHGMDLVVVYDYISDEPPTRDVFEKRDWLRLTHHNWANELRADWHMTPGFRKAKERIQLVTNIPILESDPKESRSYSWWDMLGDQVLLQREWDEQHGGKAVKRGKK